MKQMTKKDLRVLDKAVSENLTGTFQIAGGEEEPACVVQYCKRIPMGRMLMMVDTVAYAATCDGDYNPVARDMMLSRFILEYFTNIPVPMDEGQDGLKPQTAQVADLAKCYAYVFQTGLYQELMAYTELPFIEGYIDKKLAFEMEEQHGVHRLAGKAETLLEETLASWHQLSEQLSAQMETEAGAKEKPQSRQTANHFVVPGKKELS